jgi:cytidine deaminase
VAGKETKRSLEKAKDVAMFTGTTIENLFRSVERAELHALQQMWEEKEFEGNKYLVYRMNNQQMIEVV